MSPVLAALLARQLVGRPVQIDLREPAARGLAGVALKTTDGRAVVQVKPGSGEFERLLHELAHIKLHWDSIEPSTRHLRPPQSRANHIAVDYEPPAWYCRREDEAETLTQEWLDYAHRNNEWPEWMGDLGLLLTLLHWGE